MTFSADELFKIGYQAHYKERDAVRAVEYYERVIATFPESLEARYAKEQLAKLREDAPRIEDARARMERDAREEKERRQNWRLIPVSTLPFIPGFTIDETIDVVGAEVAFGMNFIKDFLVNVRDFVGGRSGALQNAIRTGREQCIVELSQQAIRVGANAVIGVTFSYSEIGTGSSILMVVATGTAVRVNKGVVA